MTNTELLLKAIIALVNVHMAMKDAQVSPPVNPVIINSIERLYLHLMDKLRQDAPADFIELAKNHQSAEEFLTQQKDVKADVSCLMDILQGFDVKDISFDKNPQNDELGVSVKLVAKSPDAASKDEALSGDDVAPATDEKVQELGSEMTVSEDKISGNIDEMNQVLGRLREMEGTVESFLSEEQREMIKTLMGEVIHWLETETTFSPSYEKTCYDLQLLIEDFIKQGFFTEASPVIEIFNKISNGTMKKDENVRKVSTAVLKNLASDENINILIHEIDISQKQKNSEACQILFGFGDVIMQKMLDGVLTANDSKDRIRIIHIIQELGERAIPAIKESMTINAPWYYLRNMAYILGRIGNETTVDLLRPLLLHKDKRVRNEAFKSISQTGGRKKGPLLLSVLLQVEQEMKIDIIAILGKIKYGEAVPQLLDMLTRKSSLSKEEQIVMQEKICNALGSIGSSEAVPALKEIAESKSFLGMGGYPEELKNTARKALTLLEKT